MNNRSPFPTIAILKCRVSHLYVKICSFWKQVCQPTITCPCLFHKNAIKHHQNLIIIEIIHKKWTSNCSPISNYSCLIEHNPINLVYVILKFRIVKETSFLLCKIFNILRPMILKNIMNKAHHYSSMSIQLICNVNLELVLSKIHICLPINIQNTSFKCSNVPSEIRILNHNQLCVFLFAIYWVNIK